MANFAACTIPLKNIRKISVYLSDCKKTLAQVKADTGADYIINGTLYNVRTHKVNCHLKVSGAVVAKPDYTVYGYAWGLGPDITMTKLPCDKTNYIACTPLIVGGKKVDKLIYDAGQGRKRGRTAIGIKSDRLALYCTRDGTGAARTPEALRDDLAAAGWDSAIMLDGGDSSQCDLAGKTVQTGRKVQHWICVWLKKEEKPTLSNDQKRAKVLSVARSQIGIKESPAGSNCVKYNDWFYKKTGWNYAWCMTCVQWVFAHADLPLPLHTASCTELANYAKAHGQWVTKGFKPGDILIMHWHRPTACEHTGIVTAVHKTYVETVEGNTGYGSQANGGCVMPRNRAYTNITGAYRPWYNM